VQLFDNNVNAVSGELEINVSDLLTVCYAVDKFAIFNEIKLQNIRLSGLNKTTNGGFRKSDLKQFACKFHCEFLLAFNFFREILEIAPNYVNIELLILEHSIRRVIICRGAVFRELHEN